MAKRRMLRLQQEKEARCQVCRNWNNAWPKLKTSLIQAGEITYGSGRKCGNALHDCAPRAWRSNETIATRRSNVAPNLSRNAARATALIGGPAFVSTRQGS